MPSIARRSLLASAAVAVAAPAIAQSSKTVKFVPSSDLAGIDPIWTTAYVVRNHGFAIYDTLYGTDAQYRIQPQMAEGHQVSADGLTWTHQAARRPPLP